MSDDSAAARLNHSQRRSLSVGLHHLAELLDEAERVLDAAARRSAFHRLANDIPPAQAGVVRDYLDRARDTLLAAARRHGLDVAGPALDARRSLGAQLTAAAIGVAEMRPGRLRGYGELNAATAEELDRTCDELDRTLDDVLRLLARGPEEDYAARLARLATTAVDPELLSALERVIREQGLVELRPLLRSVLERLEERSFHVALFGRVSSGKSSLLNALLGADVLPVGVTPVTSVPTRVRLGDPPSVRVRYATGDSDTAEIESLRTLASEAGNPGNIKRVARLEVVYPVPGLPEGVELVDTPGIGSLATAGAAEAFAYLPRTDLALLLVDAGSSLGRDEIGLLRVFEEAAIPVEVLLSKADLVDRRQLAELTAYVRAAIEREVGVAPATRPVSSVGDGRPLVRAWAEESLAPRFARRRELAAESVRRLTGRLLEEVVAALRLQLGQAPAEDADPGAGAERLRTADGRVAAARRAFDDLAHRAGSAYRSAVIGAAAAAVAAAPSGAPREADVTPHLRTALAEVAEALRAEAVATLAGLHAALLEAAREVDPAAAELLTARLPGPDLAGLPLLDAPAAVSPAVPLRGPLLATVLPRWAAYRTARALESRYGRRLRESLHGYGHRLRDFGQRAVGRIAETFHGAVGPFVAAAGKGPAEATDADRRQRLAADLATLEAFRPRAAERSA